MIATYTMTGSQVKIEGLTPAVYSVAGDPDIDPNNINPGAYGAGYVPEIMIRASRNNSQVLFLAETSGAPSPQQLIVEPGDTITIDYNQYVKAMNIFYVTGAVGDTLQIRCR